MSAPETIAEMAATPGDIVRAEIERILGLLLHASIHLERRNLGAVEEALSDATRRAHALLDEVRLRP
jgi:hypothetical protein